MGLKRSKKNGQSTLEFIVVTMVVILAFMTMQRVIVRGISGRWKTAGDSLSSRQYDPNTSLDCRFDSQFGTDVWYNFDCFYERCDCESMAASNTTCRECIRGCRTERCCQSGDIDNCNQ